MRQTSSRIPAGDWTGAVSVRQRDGFAEQFEIVLLASSL
jgi:hypothetical protein